MRSTVFFFVVMVLLGGCARAPEWQVQAAANGQLTRVHNTTGKVEYFVRGEWVAYAEAVKLAR